MKRFLLFAASAIIALPAASQAMDALQTYKNTPIDLSLNSSVLFALDQNPEIEIYWSRYNQSLSFTEEGKSAYYPEITLSVAGGREFQDPSAGTLPSKADISNNLSYGLTLEQTLFDGFRTMQEVRRRENLSDSAFWRVQFQVEDILDRTVEHYLDMVRYQEEIFILTELVSYIKKTLIYVNDQYEEGSANKVIVDYANSRLSFAQTELRKAQSSLNDAKSNLEFLVGKLPPMVNVYYPEELNPDKLDLEYYLETMREGNSAITANNYEIDAMKQQLAVAKTDDLPEFLLNVNLNQEHNNGGNIGREREASATIRMNYTLFDGFKNKHVKNRVRHQISELEMRKSQLVEEMERELKLSYNQITASAQSLVTTEDEISSSKALKVLNEENFRLGNINIIELLESAERLNTAQLKKIDLINSQYYNSYKLVIAANILDQNFFCESC